MEEGSAASRLRLSSAKRRIDAFVEQIDVLAASSFPHSDGERALAAIRKRCKGLKADLDVPPTVREDLIDGLCQRLLDEVADYTVILGFILRSTNVRNPFELHYVVKKLVADALGEDVSLLISSEWLYEAFTYPMSIEHLPDAILIGTPAPEASNPLLIPLAGHEVGHSAWRVYGCTPRYGPLATTEVKSELETNTRAVQDLAKGAPLGELDKDLLVDQCADKVMRQLEEIYCDFFGLYLFGHAYLAAFDYLLGPGNYNRVLDYPSDAQRMNFLTVAAKKMKIAVDPELIARWTVGQVTRSERPMAEVADAVVARLVPGLTDDLIAQLEARNLSIPDAQETGHILEAFRRGEPFAKRVGLGATISAGWQRLRELDVADFGETDPEEREKKRGKSYHVLADLVLKTVEIAEYHDRIDSHA